MRRNCRFDTVLFDLDGTLIDSIPGILSSFDYVKTIFPELQSVSRDAVISHIGRPFVEFMQEFVSSSEKAHEILHQYRQHNQRIIPEMPLFPGCRQALLDLRKRGFKLGIVTSKGRSSTMISVTAHKMEDFFEVIVAQEDTQSHKPNPEPLHYALERIRSFPDRSIYVGDTIYDMGAAHAAGCLSIGAGWGARDPVLLASARPTWMLQRFEELTAALID